MEQKNGRCVTVLFKSLVVFFMMQTGEGEREKERERERERNCPYCNEEEMSSNRCGDGEREKEPTQCIEL